MGEMGVSDPLEPELQAFVSHAATLPGTKLQFSVVTLCSFNRSACRDFFRTKSI